MDSLSKYNPNDRYVPNRYLACEYIQGLFSNEYIIRFNDLSSSNKGEMHISKDDLIPINEKRGLVKILGIQPKGTSCDIWINDVGDHRMSIIKVHIEDIVSIPDKSSGRK